jgi:hypothetical protein
MAIENNPLQQLMQEKDFTSSSSSSSFPQEM